MGCSYPITNWQQFLPPNNEPPLQLETKDLSMRSGVTMYGMTTCMVADSISGCMMKVLLAHRWLVQTHVGTLAGYASHPGFPSWCTHIGDF